MKQHCPKCGKRHNKFPRKCYYEAMHDNTFCVIAKTESLGTIEQQRDAVIARSIWDAMQIYIKDNGWLTDTESALEPSNSEENTLAAWSKIIMSEKVDK